MNRKIVYSLICFVNLVILTSCGEGSNKDGDIDWPAAWIIKLDTGSTKNFNDIIRSVRKVGTLTDENIDDICKKLESIGASKSQIDELKKLFKENKEINDLLKNSDDFYGALSKAKNINISDDVSEILGIVAKKTTALTERETKNIVNQTLKNLPKESQDAVDNLIKNIENAAEKKLNQITDNGLTLNNKEEVYDYMLMLLNRALKKNVDNKTIPAKRASIYFDTWSQRLKDSQKIKDKLDGIPTSANSKTTVTPKFGDNFVEPDFYVKNADGTPARTTVKGSP